MHSLSPSDGHLSRFPLEITSLFLSSTLAVRFLALSVEGKASLAAASTVRAMAVWLTT